jgi:hypothetical protein
MGTEEFDINLLKELQSPADITEAVLQLSRNTGGRVMVQLANPDKPEESIWFHPLQAQEETDNPKSYGNVRVKFYTDVEQNQLRIVAVESLPVDEKDNPIWWSKALRAFGDAKGYEDTTFCYAGKLEKKSE